MTFSVFELKMAHLKYDLLYHSFTVKYETFLHLHKRNLFTFTINHSITVFEMSGVGGLGGYLVKSDQWAHDAV